MTNSCAVEFGHYCFTGTLASVNINPNPFTDSSLTKGNVILNGGRSNQKVTKISSHGYLPLAGYIHPDGCK